MLGTIQSSLLYNALSSQSSHSPPRSTDSLSPSATVSTTSASFARTGRTHLLHFPLRLAAEKRKFWVVGPKKLKTFNWIKATNFGLVELLVVFYEPKLWENGISDTFLSHIFSATKQRVKVLIVTEKCKLGVGFPILLIPKKNKRCAWRFCNFSFLFLHFPSKITPYSVSEYCFCEKKKLIMFNLFDIFWCERLPVPVISVGNLTWGGNGKTPMVEFIARWLSDSGISPLILTRVLFTFCFLTL